ncbi:unnamed protein product [Enterobius vermicularis]|uniref:CAP-Gly domain-containing linker protein 1 n=1 Tax=Enterobius vermicularis TaxID=51028 RepID=A0A0N4VIE7_ENTVE|nr:unnamed protein product [Enterobius vermicularis]
MESTASHRKRYFKHGSPSYEDRKERHHHKSSHKRRRHKTRSRSPSGSLSAHDRKPPVVYMNPAFQQVYGSSSIVATQADIEMRTTLIGQLSAYEQRISSLESELRAAQLARGRAEQVVYEVNAEKLRVESHNSEIVQVMKTLERAVEDLQNDLKSASDESGRRQLELENVEKNLASSREQNSFLSERNMKLVKNFYVCFCCYFFIFRRDESARELAEVRPRIEALQADLRLRAEENRKLSVEIRSFEDKERVWKKEKTDLEKRIEIKDAVATAERKNNDEWKRKHLAEKAELERKVKLAEPDINRALDAESIKKAIEDVRAFYEQKLSYMLNELETLKKKSSLKETGFSSANSSNERLELEKSGRSELEYRSSSAPPASISNGLLSSSEN